MTPLPFTLRQLELFGLLAQVLNVRECARRLGISHASVSSQIALLEEQLGFDLLVRRKGRPLALTSKGAAFKADLAAFHAALDQLGAHRVDPEARAHPTRLRVLIGLALFEHYVRPRLDHLLGRHPGLDIEFLTRIPGNPRDNVPEQADVDFSLYHCGARIALPPGARELARVRCAVYGTHERAAPGGGPLSPAAISEMPFILPGTSAVQAHGHIAGLAELGITPHNIVGHSDHFDVMVSLVEHGMGVACLSEAMIAPEVRSRLCALFALEDYKLVWQRRAGLHGELVQQIEDFILACVLDNPDYPAMKSSAGPD